MNSIFIFLISWKIFLILIPVLGCFFAITISIEHFRPNHFTINENVQVVKKLSNGIAVNSSQKIIFVKTYENLSIDDLVYLKSSDVEKINSDSSFNRYLKSEGISYVANNSTIKFIGTNETPRRAFQDYLIRGPSYYSRYAPMMLLGYRYYKNKVVIDKIKNISILHLFTISGFHINIILMFIESILKRFKLKNKYIYLIPSLILIFYIVLMNFPIAATRALMFSILCLLNKHFFNNKFSKLNLLSITMLIFILVNPFIIFSTSFIFTYVLTFAILLITSSLNKKYIKLKVILIGWIFSSIINIVLNDEINFTSIITSMIFSPIVSFSYILTFLFFWLKPVMDNYYLLVDIAINIFQYIKLGISCALPIEAIVSLCSIIYIGILIHIEKPKISEEWNKNDLTNPKIYKLMNFQYWL